MNLTSLEALAEILPEEEGEKLREQITKIAEYPDDKHNLAEEFVPVLQLLIALDGQAKYQALTDQVWEDLFKGGAEFNKDYIEGNFVPDDPKFMKYLKIAFHSANPENSAQFGVDMRKKTW